MNEAEMQTELEQLRNDAAVVADAESLALALRQIIATAKRRQK